MAQRIKIQILRATSATRTSYTPDIGELIYETDTGNVFIGDGATAGGNAVLSTVGAVTDGSNEGVGGVGPFIQNNGGILEFKNINAGSNKISVTDDVANNEIDIDIVEGNINYNNLQNLPTLGTAADNDEGDFATAAQGALADSAVQPGDNVSDLTNDANYQTGAQVTTTVNNAISTHEAAADPHPAYALESSLATVATSGDYNDLTNTPVFGTEYQYAESLGESQSNSTTFQTKVTLNTGTIPSGTYRIGWSYNWSLNGTADDFEAQVLEDGATQIMQHLQEPQDAGVDQQHETGGFINRTLTAGSHSYVLQYRTDDAAVAAFIRTAKLEFWRVS